MRFSHILNLLIFAIFMCSFFYPFNVKAEEDKSEPLKFGLIMNDVSEFVPSQISKLLKDLEIAIGRDIQLIVTGAEHRSDYFPLVRRLSEGSVDIALLAPNSNAVSVKDAYSDVFARIINKGGVETYHSVFLVKQDSDIRSFEDIKSAPQKYNFSYGRSLSNFGTLLPRYFFFHHNIEPKEHFITVSHNDHKDVIEKLFSNEADIVVSDTIYLCTDMIDPDAERLEPCGFARDFPNREKDVKLLWKSPGIPMNTLAYRRDMDEGLKKQIREFFLNYGQTPEQKEILAAIDFYNIEGFAPMDNADLQYLIDIRAQRRGLLETSDQAEALRKAVQSVQQTELFFEHNE